MAKGNNLVEERYQAALWVIADGRSVARQRHRVTRETGKRKPAIT